MSKMAEPGNPEKKDKCTLLVVDDEPVTVQSVIDFLFKPEYNYRILYASDGKKALKIIEKDRPNLIILDWDMPEMSGIELLNQLKNNKKYADIPVVMATGVMTEKEDLFTALEAGAVDYLQKPIDHLELLARIQSALRLADSKKDIKKQKDEIEAHLEKLQRQKDEIELQKNELKEINAIKDKIFSIIGHDLKNTVGNSKSVLDILDSDPHAYPQDQLPDIISLLKKSCDSAYYLLDNLLFWSRAQRNELVHEPETFLASDIFDEVLQDLDKRIKEKNIEIKFEENPDVNVYSDSNMFENIIRNMLLNAITFTPENSHITISFRQNTSVIHFSITDQGPGIPDKELSGIYHSYDLLQPKKRKTQGAGLGLIVSKTLIEKCGGKLELSNQDKGGLKVNFSLPKI